MEKFLVRMNTIFGAAIELGAEGEDEPRCAGISRNPFRRIALTDFKYQQPPANIDFKQALSSASVESLADVIAPWARAAVWVCVWAMLRGGELLALRRADIRLPTGVESRGQAEIIVSHTLGPRGRLKPWGRTGWRQGCPSGCPLRSRASSKPT